MSLRPLPVTTAFLAFAVLSTAPALGQRSSNRSIHASGGVPLVPEDLEGQIDRYRFYQSADLQGWVATSRRILYLTSSDGVQQPFVGQEPGEPGWNFTETGRPVAWAYSNPRRQQVIIAEDDDGNEQHQLTIYYLLTGRSRRVTNGQWENRSARWSRSGHLLAFTSNARNGKDGDLYVVDPSKTAAGRRLKEATGTLFAESWAPDDKRLAAVEFTPNLRDSRVHLIEVATGQTQTLPVPPGKPIERSSIRWSADGGSLYWLTDRDSDFMYLAKYDLATGIETKLTDRMPGGVELFATADDDRAALLVVNEDGRTRLHVIDPRTGKELPGPRLADGVIGSVIFRRRSHEFAFEWSCARLRRVSTPTTWRPAGRPNG